MKFFQQSYGLPEKAGLATLEYADVESPSREGDVIVLPRDGWSMAQLTRDASQFLLVCNKRERGEYPAYRAWFGGTDEKPFLTELEAGNWFSIWESGNFYKTIKPEIISHFEYRFGADKTVRQGDMFCYPMPIQDWGQLLTVLEAAKRLHFMRFGLAYNCERDHLLDPYPTICDGPWKLYETRHEFYGELALWGEYAVGKGTIMAPDHTDLVLPAISVIAQTARLKDAQKAD